MHVCTTHTNTDTHTHSSHLYKINEVFEGGIEVSLFTEADDVTKVGVVNVGVHSEETL